MKNGIGRLPWYALVLWAIVIAGVFQIIKAGVIEPREQLNLHAFQAQAFLEGRLDLPVRHHDVAIVGERIFSPFPPVPAVLLVPVVALFGVERTNVVVVALAFTLVGILAFVSILQRLGIQRADAVWLVAAFFLGTGYLYVLGSSWGVWHFSHVVAVTFLLLALREAIGEGRGVPVGLYLGAAFLSRQVTIYAAVFLFTALWRSPRLDRSAARHWNAVLFIVVLSSFVGAYLLFNQVRFGNPFDTGYAHLQLQGFLKQRVVQYGTFSLAYVPANLIHLFVQGFHLVFTGRDQLTAAYMSPMGTSLTAASPFIFVALFARWQTPLLRATWVSVGLAITHQLLYYNNGWVQINAQRFTLDFLPLLMILVALGTARVPAVFWRPLVGYAIGLNLLALYFVRLFFA